MRVTKRIIEYDAFQLTAESRWNDTAWPDWLRAAYAKESTELEAVSPAPDVHPARGRDAADPLVIRKGLGLTVQVNIGDWILREESSGELQQCDAERFKLRFEPL